MLSRLILSTAFCGLAISPLMASTYSSSYKTTVMGLSESSDPWSLSRGTYTTRVNDQAIFGFISIHSVAMKRGLFTYQGSFQDRSYGSGAETVCSGQIMLKRIPSVAGKSPYAMRVTWIPEASTCQYSDQTTTLTLHETLPVADAYGEYLASNANTMRSETNGDVTWMAWKATSSDGELNCREKESGAVVHTYSKDEVIFAETRGGNAFIQKGSQSWMQTRKGCLVRANSLYISPLSVPDQYRPE